MFYKSILLLLLTIGFVSAQGIVVQVTATQGDGSTCIGTQNPGINVNFTFTCTAALQGKPTGSYRIYEGGGAQVKAPISHSVQLGDVLCMFGDNPTNYTVNFVSLPSAPPHSLSYSCVVNVRTSGAITGDVPSSSGVITWSTSTKRNFWSRWFRP